MGDLIGEAVSGTLYHVPVKEFDRIRSLSISATDRAALFAALARINTLYMIARAGSGHIGSSFSSMDMLSWLHLEELKMEQGDLFFSSKGHDAPGLYNILIGLGRLDADLIHRLRKLGGLPGHPDIGTPNMVTNTGSLGMGVSKAKGMIFANRLQGRSGNIYVLTGDGELQEGQFWESLISAANHKLSELTVIIDHNKLQSDTLVAKVSDLGDLSAKLAAFGWHVARCDGNDITAFSSVLADLKGVTDRPKVIVADTVKGRGVSFMQHTSMDSDVEFYKFHSGAPTEDAYVRAAQELIDSANALLSSLNAPDVELETVTRPAAPAATTAPQRMVPAYSDALIAAARANPKIVALDADLILDTGLIPFQQQFPDRFLECGIAEQDMVSQAGGMALRGMLPVVHSFGCFLSARPNEQIYNNATEHTKIVYVGSLAGVLPAGPGHSHQAVRDISSLGGIPGLVMMEPSCEAEVGMLLDWALNDTSESSYIRLTSIPCVIPYTLPDGYRPELGKGVALTEAGDVVIFAYGPVMLPLAVQGAEMVRQDGLAVKIVNLPWLNRIDASWLGHEVEGARAVISLDNHYSVGGQGDRIAETLALLGSKTVFRRVALSEVPASGTNDEVLERSGLGIAAIVAAIHSI